MTKYPIKIELELTMSDLLVLGYMTGAALTKAKEDDDWDAMKMSVEDFYVKFSKALQETENGG